MLIDLISRMESAHSLSVYEWAELKKEVEKLERSKKKLTSALYNERQKIRKRDDKIEYYQIKFNQSGRSCANYRTL